MATRSLEEQEKDIKDVLRRAERQPVRTSATRRDALQRLIDIAHSSQPRLKTIAANNFKYFIKDFPDLEDDAINAVYDLCEDQVTTVRICGYGAIVDVSREQYKWVKRNADVLVQLLQSDEPDEVLVVKRALSQHLDMDPALTLGVLCDQVIPPDEPMDEEEQAIRNRLRFLVLSFITGEAKRAIVERHAVPRSPAEDTLVNGLFKAIGKLGSEDIEMIVKEIVLSLPSFKVSSPRGEQLLESVLDRARASLKTDLLPGSESASLHNTRYFLDLASCIVVEKHVAPAVLLLRFYFTSLASKITLMRLDERTQAYVLTSIADIVAAYEHGPSEASVEDALLRKQIPDVCVVLLQVFAEIKMGQLKPWKACHTFLKVCQRHKDEYTWVVPHHFGTILQNILSLITSQGQTSKVDNAEDIQVLIRSLLSAIKPAVLPSPSTSAAAAGDASTSVSNSSGAIKPERRIVTIKRKFAEHPSLPPRPAASTLNGFSPNQTSSMNRTSTKVSQVHQRASTVAGDESHRNGKISTTDEHPRAAKRAKNGDSRAEDISESPSLLSRLAGTTSNDHTTERGRALNAKRRIESAPGRYDMSVQLPQDPDKDPVGGYSIKGAAKVAGRRSPLRDSPPSRTSLLERMQGGFEEMSGHRREKRTK